jgi:hypothetical protein
MKAQSTLMLATITTAGLLNACVNMSTLQTARTLKPGQWEATVGGGYYESPDLNEAVEEVADTEVDRIASAYTELTLRRGLTDNLDLGLKATLPGTGVIDGKYQFVDSGGLAVAAGAGLGYLSLESGTGDETSESTIFETHGTVYASYDVAPWFAIYAAPKYIGRFYGGESSGTSHMVGATGGIKLGKRVGLYLETSHMTALNADDFTAQQFNGSLFFGF